MSGFAAGELDSFDTPGADTEMEDKRKSQKLITQCICCGSGESKPFYVINNIPIVCCKMCGLLYAKLQPEWKDLQSLYSDYEIPEQWEYGSEFYNQEIINLIVKVTPKGGRILEVGCSYGKILSQLHDKGFIVQGVEASLPACRYIDEKYNFPIYYGLVENYLEEIGDSRFFNTIIFLNVVEHLSDPYSTLVNLDRILKPNGHMLIIVPDIQLAMNEARLRKMVFSLDPFCLDRSSTIAFTSPGHLYYFSRRTMARLCERLNWNIIEHRHAPYVLSGRRPKTYKDLLKQVLYNISRFFEKSGLPSPGLSYSQMVLARKPSQEKNSD